MDNLEERERKYIAGLDDRIAELTEQIAVAQGELHVVRQKRASAAGESMPKGISTLGLDIVRKNNTLSKMRRTGASKGDIQRVERELGDMRARLAEQKRGGR